MYKAHIVAHTHWDREWYKTFQHFRVKLMFFIDKLLDVLENDSKFKYFMLDGQTIMLEDYLQIKPQNYIRIKKLIEEGKLIIGPWYVQPDEFVPDGESLIRNLLIGHRMSKEFGGTMKVGHLPDSFGQSCQMPQILRGFGIKSATMMRGVDAGEVKSTEFNWIGLNGDEVIGIYFPFAYSNSMFLPRDFNKAYVRTSSTVAELKAWSQTGNLLLMNGNDHEWIEEHNTDYIDFLNSLGGEIEYINSNLEIYANELEKHKHKFKAKIGELIAPVRNRVHTSIVSVRMYEKQANKNCEVALENYAEPIATIAYLNGSAYPKEILNQSWKYLIQNQAHDSMGGCCVDEAHKEIDQRFKDSETIARTLINAYSRAISRKIQIEDKAIVVFNNAMTLNKQLVKAVVYLDHKEFILRDDKNRIIDYDINSISKVSAATLNIYAASLNMKEDKYKIEFSFYVDFNSNVGYKIFKLEQGINTKLQEKKSIVIKGTQIENKYYIININPNGSLDVFDKETRKRYKGLNAFEDCGDAGDTYNFSPVLKDKVVTSEKSQAIITVVKEGINRIDLSIKLNLNIPQKLINNDIERSDSYVDMPIETLVSIYSDIKRIDFKTEITNNALDHRVRALFPTGIISDHSFAETQFGTITRSNKLDDSRWITEKWVEKPLPIYSQQGFVDINDGNAGFSVLNIGLPEYEIYEREDSVIALTLFRGVGFMGKKELPIRPGRASGIEMETPDAQCLGRRIAEYSIIPHTGDWHDGNIPSLARDFNVKPWVVQNNIKLNTLPKEVELFEIETLTGHIKNTLNDLGVNDLDLITIDNNSIMISAVKKAQDNEDIIIRLYNSSYNPIENQEIKLGINNIQTVSLTNFNEDFQGDILGMLDDNTFIIKKLNPYTALTLRISLRK